MSQVTIDPNGHWIWTGSVNQSGIPMWRPKAGRTSYSARKAIWKLNRPWYDEQRWRVVRSCKEDRCVNPDHARLELIRNEEYTSGGKGVG